MFTRKTKLTRVYWTMSALKNDPTYAMWVSESKETITHTHTKKERTVKRTSALIVNIPVELHGGSLWVIKTCF